MHVLWNQLILELSYDLFNTLQICYRHTEDVHDKVWCWKIFGNRVALNPELGGVRDVASGMDRLSQTESAVFKPGCSTFQISLIVVVFHLVIHKCIFSAFWKRGGALCSSIGSVSAWHASGPRVRPPRPTHSFVETWSWKNFYGHSPSPADSRRSVVSYWRKNVH